MREFLLDVSRLIWRAWGRRHPTGIDRVCLAYLEHFKGRAQAVVQRKGFRIVLSSDESDRLFQLIMKGREASRVGWVMLGLSLLSGAFRTNLAPGTIYLNVGHTGLDEPSLPEWIKENRLRAVYLIHDLIPLTHPQYCRAGEETRHAKRMENLLASASGVIANSRATLVELEQFARSRGQLMPANVVALIAGHQTLTSQQRTRLGRPYFVVVGTIEARKNHKLLLEVWRKLVREFGDTAPILVIVGQRGWEVEPTLAILDNLGQLAGHVIEVSNCKDEDMAAWVAGARALLMPSFVEGFGLPVVEALQLSTPVIASDLPVYRELASDIPTYLEPDDEAGWLAAIKEFTTQGPERTRQVSAISGFQSPSWPTHFNQIEPWLAQID